MPATKVTRESSPNSAQQIDAEGALQSQGSWNDSLADIADLLKRVEDAPDRFDFFAFMRELESKLPDRVRFGRAVRPAEDLLRFGQEPVLTHTPSAIAGIERGNSGQPDRLQVHFLGLLGPDGPLPLHLTEYLRDRRRNHRDAAPYRFIDMFHHRLLSLFYRAWADVRPTVSFDRPTEDRFSHYVGAFIGLSTPGLRERDAMPDLTKLHFAGLLSNQTRHAEGLGQILSAFFSMPVRVHSFRGAWLLLPKSDRSGFPGDESIMSLGRSIVLGTKVWSRQHKFRLVFGPLSLVEYERLLPGGLSFRRLVSIVRNYIGDVLIWDVNLVLRADQVPPMLLGKQGRLGWTTWLMPRSSGEPAADLQLDASADSNARAVERVSLSVNTGSCPA
jgi:type VI secretion system protein ImpH